MTWAFHHQSRNSARGRDGPARQSRIRQVMGDARTDPAARARTGAGPQADATLQGRTEAAPGSLSTGMSACGAHQAQRRQGPVVRMFRCGSKPACDAGGNLGSSSSAVPAPALLAEVARRRGTTESRTDINFPAPVTTNRRFPGARAPAGSLRRGGSRSRAARCRTASAVRASIGEPWGVGSAVPRMTQDGSRSSINRNSVYVF